MLILLGGTNNNKETACGIVGQGDNSWSFPLKMFCISIIVICRVKIRSIEVRVVVANKTII